jgi:hypothetical protein
MKYTKPQASILIPTHNKASQLRITVESALSQSVEEIEVIIVGDGVLDKCRSIIEELQALDPRVVFLDFPKGPNHGEVYRHEAIRAAQSDAIFYLCDDDLLLRDHVADLLDLLERFSFVQSLNGAVNPDGEVTLYPGVLSDTDTLNWIIRKDRRYNSVSLTGTAHSRSIYIDAGQHWETTPSNEWPDHHQWRRMLSTGKFSTATSRRMTALQFPTGEHGRHLWSEEERLIEQRKWKTIISAPEAQKRIDEIAWLGTVQQLGRTYRQTLEYHFELEATLEEKSADRDLFTNQIDDLNHLVQQISIDAQRCQIELDHAIKHHRSETERLQRQINQIRERHRQTIAAIERTISWRITAPLRYVRRIFKKMMAM